MKTDKSIKNICMAAIRRRTIEPINYPLTKIFNTEPETRFINETPLLDGELAIFQILIDKLNWTLVTTRRIISCFNGDIQEAFASEVISWSWGDFKGYTDNSTTTGKIKLSNGNILNIHIETGKASMIIIYSIMTLAKQYDQRV